MGISAMLNMISEKMAAAAIAHLGEYLPEIKKLAVEAAKEFFANHDIVISVKKKETPKKGVS